MSPQKPKPKPQPSRYWIFDPWDKTRIKCLKSTIRDCHVVGLWQGDRSDFHDAELQNATEEINKILDRVERDNEDVSRHLCLIKFQSRLMLVWSHHGEVVSSHDADRDIAKALKIKGFK
jgi:hypothetical protein